MAFSVEGIPAGDMKRFAICYLFSDRTNVDWNAAATAYDPKVQVSSFKTVTSKATKKALEGVAQQAVGADGEDEAAPKPAKKGGKRKKADTEGDGAATPKAKKPRAKKSKSDEKVQSSGDEDNDVKAESDD